MGPFLMSLLCSHHSMITRIPELELWCCVWQSPTALFSLNLSHLEPLCPLGLCKILWWGHWNEAVLLWNQQILTLFLNLVMSLGDSLFLHWETLNRLFFWFFFPLNRPFSWAVPSPLLCKLGHRLLVLVLILSLYFWLPHIHFRVVETWLGLMIRMTASSPGSIQCLNLTIFSFHCWVSELCFQRIFHQYSKFFSKRQRHDDC